MKVKVGVVQPFSVWGEDEYKNIDTALFYLEKAAKEGADLVCFPEGFPGPAHGPLNSKNKLSATPIEMLCEKTRELGVYVAASNVESNPEHPGTYFLCQKLISPKGEIIGDHARVQPDEPDLNEYLFGGKRDFAPGKEPVVVETDIGNIGLLICSELYVPELARIEMLKGAEIIIAPVNGFHQESLMYSKNPPLWDTWKCISRARAAENLVYVIVTQNLFVKGYLGVGHVAGPENMIAQSQEEGLFWAELDMDRLQWLREQIFEWKHYEAEASEETQRPMGCRPGQHILRKPDIYKKLTEALPTDYDYYYYKK